MTVKSFAPDYPLKEGFIDFGRDVELRRKLFVPESMNHPAKLNLNLLQDLINYLTEPGDMLLDPMSGTGSIMMATEPVALNRRVVCIEDVPLFHYIQTMNKSKFVERGVPPDNITLLFGPCQDYLPLPALFNHIIFSPPYSDVMVPPGSKNYATENKKGFAKDRDIYNYDAYQGATKKNLGSMSTFHFNMEATRVYQMLFDSLKPGGTMTVVIQDKIRGGKREGLTDWMVRTCVKSGFMLSDWFKRYSPGSGMKRMQRIKGITVVDDEDVVVLRRPK